MKTIVVGAGIIGASIAWQVTRAGGQVVVIDGGLPAASSASFGWINASFYADAAHHRLRAASLSAWAALHKALPQLPVSRCGALWWEEQGAGLQRMKSDLQSLDYPVEYLTQEEAQAAEPDILGLPDAALLFPAEAAAEPAAVARALLAASGCQILRGVRAEAVLADDRHVRGVRTSIGEVLGDRVVIAAGNGAPEILQSIGVALPMLRRPGVLVTTGPVAAQIRHILVTPHGEVRQLPDGRLLASAVAGHQGDDAEVVTETPDQIAARLLGWLDPMVRGGVPDWQEVSLAHRPMPQDGLPVIGPAGPAGLHVAVMHSGVTLAAITAEAIAAEINGTERGGFAALLAPYGPDRFA